jgi:hypothetical protein
MKTYEEMILWVADNDSRLRYHEWPALMAIAEMFNKPYDEVHTSLNDIKERRKVLAKEAARAKHRAEHEARRHANLAKANAV